MSDNKKKDILDPSITKIKDTAGVEASDLLDVQPGGLRRKGKGTYSISVVAEMFGVHQQTIRLYEKEGLIAPNRSAGNTRQFTEEDVDRLEEVIYLTHKLGVNLAGVSIILKLKKKVRKLQGEVNKLFEQVEENLELEGSKQQEEAATLLHRLATIKKSNAKNDANNEPPISLDFDAEDNDD